MFSCQVDPDISGRNWYFINDLLRQAQDDNLLVGKCKLLFYCTQPQVDRKYNFSFFNSTHKGFICAITASTGLGSLAGLHKEAQRMKRKNIFLRNLCASAPKESCGRYTSFAS
jgi:hypothetical protein